MWAKGPQPGYGIKEEVLKVRPKAVCHKMSSNITGLTRQIVGFVVFEEKDGRAIGSAGNAFKAWLDAYEKLRREGVAGPLQWEIDRDASRAEALANK